MQNLQNKYGNNIQNGINKLQNKSKIAAGVGLGGGLAAAGMMTHTYKKYNTNNPNMNTEYQNYVNQCRQQNKQPLSMNEYINKKRRKANLATAGVALGSIAATGLSMKMNSTASRDSDNHYVEIVIIITLHKDLYRQEQIIIIIIKF